MQHEITTPSKLLDQDGRLIQKGWARQPYLDCNLENLSFYAVRLLQFLRVKRWDYYAVFTPDVFFSATVADIGYLGNLFVYLIDFETVWLREESILVPFANGVSLPQNSTEGDTVFDNGNVSIKFHLSGDMRRVMVDWPGYNKGEGIVSDITLHLPPEHESIVMATPFDEKRFYYNRKVNCLPAEGWIRRGSREYSLDARTCLGGLDWGRGVWPYKSFWNWASASAYLPDGRALGLNMGEGFGDLSHTTENCFILDGRVHKLENIPYQYDPSDYMKPWRFVSSDGRLDLEFVPFVERAAKTNLLVLVSEVHQMFGCYSGWLVTDEGERIEVRDMIGFAEEHHAKW